MISSAPLAPRRSSGPRHNCTIMSDTSALSRACGGMRSVFLQLITWVQKHGGREKEHKERNQLLALSSPLQFFPKLSFDFVPVLFILMHFYQNRVTTLTKSKYIKRLVESSVFFFLPFYRLPMTYGRCCAPLRRKHTKSGISLTFFASLYFSASFDKNIYNFNDTATPEIWLHNFA